MLDVKTDALEASFEALEREDEDVAALREEVSALKARVEAQAVAGARPALAGELDGWRMVSLGFLRGQVRAEASGEWTALSEYRARMLKL